MKLAATLLIALALVGCQSAPVKPEPVVVKQYERIVVLPPAQLLQLPPPVPNLDVDHATQADVAQWLISKENYTRAVQNDLVEIGKFFATVQSKADADAAAATATAAASAAAVQTVAPPVEKKPSIEDEVVKSLLP